MILKDADFWMNETFFFFLTSWHCPAVAPTQIDTSMVFLHLIGTHFVKLNAQIEPFCLTLD